VLIAGLRALRPDVVALQDTIKSDEYDQPLDLLGADYNLVHQSRRAANGSAVSIASRWPVGAVRQVDLHVTARVAGFPCTTLVAEILAPDPIGPLLLVNKRTSWQWGAELERGLEAVAVARFVEGLVGSRPVHVVLASDLNAAPDAASLRFLCGLQSLGGTSVCYQDAWQSLHPGEPGHTFSPRNPLVPAGEMPRERGRRIDYVLVRCGDHGPTLEVAACALVFDEAVDGTWASDHFGVVADLAPVPRSPPSPS
jgi:endonuclease/exonuclease/phosphatase family metal-dependent hydrolase